MKAIIILNRCRAAEKDLATIQEKIERRRERLDDTSAPQVDPNGGSRGSGDKDKTGRLMGEIDALERQKQAREDAKNAEEVAAIALVDRLPDLEGKVIYKYYVKRMDTTAIAKDPKDPRNRYTAGYIRKVKRNAEQLLDMIDPEQVAALLPPWYVQREE